jgi:hypothetical protein
MPRAAMPLLSQYLRRLKECCDEPCRKRRDQSLQLWKVLSGQLRRVLPSEDEVMSLAYSPDGRLLAVAKNRTASRLSSNGTTDTAQTGATTHPAVGRGRREGTSS